MSPRSWTTLAEGLRFPEGPCAMDDGSVVLVEIARGTLSRVADGDVTVVGECGGGPNGAAVGPDGAFYVCNNGGFEWHEVEGLLLPGEQPASYIGGRIQRVDPASGQVTDVYTAYQGRGLRGPNDIVFDEHGGFYFTDFGKTRPYDADRGAVYYGRPDGGELRLVAGPLDLPNGCALSPDGSVLYVQESMTGRIWCWTLAEPGVAASAAGTPFGPSGGTLFHSLPGYQLLDSMAVDSEGNVCAATGITGCITVIAPDGTLREQIEMPTYDPLVTNICFGGPDRRTAYITSSGRGLLYATEWHCPGLKLNFT